MQNLLSFLCKSKALLFIQEEGLSPTGYLKGERALIVTTEEMQQLAN